MSKPPELRKAACCMNCEFLGMKMHSRCLKHSYQVDICETCADFQMRNEEQVVG